jgi:hypothetical protein
MPATVLYKPAAQAEVTPFRSTWRGFGPRFLDEIGRVEHLLRDNLLRRFPYGLFYVIDRDRVLVLACFRLHRKPPPFVELLAR